MSCIKSHKLFDIDNWTTICTYFELNKFQVNPY